MPLNASMDISRLFAWPVKRVAVFVMEISRYQGLINVCLRQIAAKLTLLPYNITS